MRDWIPVPGSARARLLHAAIEVFEEQGYDAAELKRLRTWLTRALGERLANGDTRLAAQLDQSLALYLIMRDTLRAPNAVGGGFMNQLAWGRHHG